MDNKIYIFALAAHGTGISGGDRIFIEFAKYWSREHSVNIYLWEEGLKMCQRQNLSDPAIKFEISKINIKNFLINYLSRIIEGIKLGLTLKLENSSHTIVYSASEFWMDSLPAFLLKIRNPKIKWVAAWYQTAPNPLNGELGLRGLPYWFVQLPIKPLIESYADFVLVNNDNEKKVFEKLNKKDKALVVLGAIDLEAIDKWRKEKGVSPKTYDAVFQGRFHPQKGVLELINIWKEVIRVKHDARIALIGDGPLMSEVKSKIKEFDLEKNVDLFGFVFDGDQKFSIFNSSKVVVHPAVFDSGGMASAEAMAFGIPCVGFNLDSYKYYYPKGMIKVNRGDLKEFANKILELLNNKSLYKKMSNESKDLIDSKWSWQYRSRQILAQVLE